MTVLTRSVFETEREGEKLGVALRPGDIVALYGGLGVGKTAFTRGLALGLGIEKDITSPTFTIVNEYAGGRIPLFHFDMYRLDSENELFDIGWDDYLERNGVIVVEWSEKIISALPHSTIIVRIQNLSSENVNERRIIIEGGAKSC